MDSKLSSTEITPDQWQDLHNFLQPSAGEPMVEMLELHRQTLSQIQAGNEIGQSVLASQHRILQAIERQNELAAEQITIFRTHFATKVAHPFNMSGPEVFLQAMHDEAPPPAASQLTQTLEPAIGNDLLFQCDLVGYENNLDVQSSMIDAIKMESIKTEPDDPLPPTPQNDDDITCTVMCGQVSMNDILAFLSHMQSEGRLRPNPISQVKYSDLRILLQTYMKDERTKLLSQLKAGNSLRTFGEHITTHAAHLDGLGVPSDHPARKTVLRGRKTSPCYKLVGYELK